VPPAPPFFTVVGEPPGTDAKHPLPPHAAAKARGEEMVLGFLRGGGRTGVLFRRESRAAVGSDRRPGAARASRADSRSGGRGCCWASWMAQALAAGQRAQERMRKGRSLVFHSWAILIQEGDVRGPE
jgi:hypothetical protein